jgi:23S rRNA pseudouridine1911/1915/1917 synthase
MVIPILYSDDNLIVINKPPGISVHGGISVSGETLTDILSRQFPEILHVGDDPHNRPGIVHRLDKYTSGVMVAARSHAAFYALKKLFKEGRMEKTYEAIVCGSPKKKSGVITMPIGRLVKNPLRRGVQKGKRQIRGARHATTRYRVIAHDANYAHVQLMPETGRMHQLRIHLEAIGHPIACDTTYGGKNVCCPPDARRQLLHARSISFSYPEGRRLYFEAGLPEDFAIAAHLLQKTHQE